MSDTAAPVKEKASKKEKSSGRSKAFTIIGIVMCVILVPILVINVIMIIQGLTNPGKVPGVFGYSPMMVMSPSMEPAIYEGDLIVINSVDPNEIKEDDVISFYTPKRYRGSNEYEITTHRCIKVIENADGTRTFYTRGDNNYEDDPWNETEPVTSSDLVGRYVFRLPGLGNVAMWLQSTPGLIVCIAVPIILLVGYDLIMKKRYDKKKKTDTDALLAELEELRAKAAAGSAGEKAPVEEAKPAEAESAAKAEPAAKAETEPEAAKSAADSDMARVDALIDEITNEDNTRK